MTLPALYVLTEQYRADLERLADLDLDPQTFADTLESMGGDLQEKAQSVAMFARNLEATADAIKAHRETQKAREDAIRKRAEHTREYLANCMRGAGIERIEGPGIRLSFRKSSAVIVDGVDLIPGEYMRQPETPPPEPNKKAIGDALKAGQDVPGAHIEHRTNLVIS